MDVASALDDCATTLAVVCRHLQEFAAGEALSPFGRVASAPGDIPQRWSTRGGSYQLKIVAPLCRPSSRVPEELRRVCKSVYRHWRDRFIDIPATDPHAFFYGLEGLLNAGASGFDGEAFDLAAEIYRARVLSSGLPDWLDPDMPSTRSDVLAQALRVGTILGATGHLQRKDLDEVLATLCERLESYVSNEGALFLLRTADSRIATWGAMFAHQAFLLYALLQQGAAIDRSSIELLV
jgi:hypothetical protein